MAPASSCCAPGSANRGLFFVRKFDVQNATLEQLIQDDHAELPIGLIRYLVMGERITAITGAQGSGKTTLLTAMVRYIPAILPIRVQEMSFELQLRKIYRDRNILSLRETETISGQDGLDIQKKNGRLGQYFGRSGDRPGCRLDGADGAGRFAVHLVYASCQNVPRSRLFAAQFAAEDRGVYERKSGRAAGRQRHQFRHSPQAGRGRTSLHRTDYRMRPGGAGNSLPGDVPPQNDDRGENDGVHGDDAGIFPPLNGPPAIRRAERHRVPRRMLCRRSSVVRAKPQGNRRMPRRAGPGGVRSVFGGSLGG